MGQVKGIEIKMENQEFENSQIPTSNVETKQENYVDLSQRQTRSNLNNMSQNDSVFVCEQCNKQYSSNASLWKHNKAFHSDTKYSCEKCNYQTSYKDHLSRHMKLHTKYR